jgi:signal transduction histidine kinase
MKIKKIWARLLFIFFDVSVRTKIVGLVLLCILFSSASLIWYTDRDAKAALRTEAEAMGVSLANALAGHSMEAIQQGDYTGLRLAINDYAESEKNVSYVFILDSFGILLAQSSKGVVIGDLAGLDKGGTGKYPLLNALRINGEDITDVAVPIGEGAGMVHVGISFNNISHTVAQHVHHIALWLVLTTGLGLTLAYVLSRAMTRPIHVLAAEAHELGHGSYAQRNRRWGHDEIGALGDAFDEMSREIRQKEQMRSQLVAQVLSAQEDERKRIARELHDDTSQSLTSLLVELKAAEKTCNSPAVQERLTALRALAHKTLEDVHNIAMELRPNVLDDLGLSAALEKYALEYAAKTGIKVDLQISEAARRRWPADIETATYRITQEAIANATRHGEAKNLSIVVSFEEGNLSIIVEDDGKGFDLEEAMARSPEQRLGLFGMYERASLIGGRLEIESTPGQGTGIFLEVPIKQPEGDNHARQQG